MKTTKKFIYISAALALFVSLTFTMSADAAKLIKAKKVIKKPVVTQVVKKVVKPVPAKIVVPAVKKQPAPVIKKPVVVTPPKVITLPTSTSPVQPTTTVPNVVVSTYPWHNDILATQFYIGETGLSGTTAWDCHAVTHYGGVDSPFGRVGYLPSFTPKENSFYLALPYTDIGQDGAHKKDIPWYDAKIDTSDGYSFLKNRWVEVKRGDKVCYGQYEDSLTPDILDSAGNRIGYGKSNYFDYVFGTAPATHPGIDVSPALSTCLGMYDASDTVYAHSDAAVSWKFVKDIEVPTGAWKSIVTVTPVSWDNCN